MLVFVRLQQWRAPSSVHNTAVSASGHLRRRFRREESAKSTIAGLGGRTHTVADVFCALLGAINNAQNLAGDGGVLAAAG